MFERRLICGDVLDVLPKLGRFKVLLADPPDNIGLGYGDYDDDMPLRDYQWLFNEWLWAAVAAADISWISFNARHVFWVGHCVDTLIECRPHIEAKLFIQSFTFGQHQQKDCGNGYRPLLRLKHKDAPLYPDAIREPSTRQLTGDKRADPRGRVPLDHWQYHRITGNCKERRPWHPTQLREAMIKRIVDFSTLPGESVCDCFSGSGTVFRAVDDRPVTAIEIDPVYCEKIAAEHGMDIELTWGRAA